MEVRYKFAVMSVAVAAGFAAFLPNAARAETLSEALAEAYTTNPDLVAERARVRAVDEQVPQALSNWRPQVFVNGRYGYRNVDRDSPLGDTDTTTHPGAVGLEINQNIFRGFRTQAETERARNRVAAARSDLLGAEQSILLEGVVAFGDMLRDDAVLDLRINNVMVIEEQLRATQDRFDVGELTRTDVAQAESRLARAISDRTAAEADLETSRAA